MKQKFCVRFLFRTILMPTTSVQLVAAENVHLSVDVYKTRAKIDRNIFGQFAEKLDHGLYEGIWVGPDSTIPDTRGIRNDVVAALRDLKVPNVPRPGGCFADQYHWRKRGGPGYKRPATENSAWGDVIDSNAFGTDEFMDFIQQIGSTPYVSVNVGSGAPQEGAQWLKYTTATAPSPLAKERATNGHPDAYKVGFLGIVNESWDCGGAMTPDYCVSMMKVYSRFVGNMNPAQRDKDQMLKIAVGPGAFDIKWTEAVMKTWKEHTWVWDINGLSLHWYTVPDGWPSSTKSEKFSLDDHVKSLKSTLFMKEFLAVKVQDSKLSSTVEPASVTVISIAQWPRSTKRRPEKIRMFSFKTIAAPKTFSLSLGLLIIPLLALSACLFSQTRPVNATIDTAKIGAPISKNIYGQFLEHGGDIVNTGVWSEMLVDRKFFYPVAAKAPTPPPVLGNAAGNPRFNRIPTRWWAPIGGDDVVMMDTKAPYAGDQTPLIKLDGKEPHGFKQSGIAVRKGKAYTGHILLAASSGSVVKVTLFWGQGATGRQTVTIHTLGAAYHKFPLHYTAAADTDDATLEIAGTGPGSFHVGAVSLMPADNIEGFRPEVVAALKQLRFGVLRFPGGNFVSSYEWRYGVGDIDKRPPIFDPVWHAVQPNDVGTDEFLTLCRLLDVDPYITVNAGFGDAWSARDLVEYTNGAATTPMGKWRAANGHPEPYHVKFWGVGNEPWGDYQMGSMSLPQFQLKHNLFAKEMRKVDPSITLIAGGAMPDVMEGADQARRINGQYVPDYLSTADWTGQLLLNCLDNIDMVSEHYYASGTEHTDIKLQKKVPINPPLSFLEWQRAPAVQVRAKYEHYQEYLKRIPALRSKPVPIAIDEWAYFGGGQNSYKTVPAYAWAFHEMFRHSDVFQMGALTFATATMSSNRTEAILNPTGMLFKMYRDHFGTLPIEVNGDSPQPKPRFPAGGDQPAVNPGSNTYPLDVSAAFTEDRKTLTIAVLNPSDSQQSIAIAVNGSKLATAGNLWRMAPDSIDATVQVDKKPEVQVEEQTLGPLPATITVRPFSVNIYSYPVQ